MRPHVRLAVLDTRPRHATGVFPGDPWCRLGESNPRPQASLLRIRKLRSQTAAVAAQAPANEIVTITELQQAMDRFRNVLPF